MYWKVTSIIKDNNPLTKLVPLTIPATVEPKATFIITSNRVTGAIHLFEDIRK